MQPHKAYRISIEDRTIWVTVQGVSTVLTTRDYIQELKRKVKNLSFAPWAIVLDLRKWEASPAEIFLMLQQATSWCLEHNLRHSETLLPENTLLMWQFVKTTDVDKPDFLTSNIAVDDEAARLSLQAAGYLNQPRGR